jgi:DNA-binding transcriptional regulator YhcF (GntR family)
VGRKLTVEFILDPDEPVTHQIVEHIMRMVAIGVYRPGETIFRSAAALAEQLGISRKIVQHSYPFLD